MNRYNALHPRDLFIYLFICLFIYLMIFWHGSPSIILANSNDNIENKKVAFHVAVLNKSTIENMNE